MATLPDVQIKKLVESGHLVIRPFDPERVEPASYDLRLGTPVLASPLGPDELGNRVELTEDAPSYDIQTGQMVAVISKEWLEFPLDICSAGFGIRSAYAGKGIVAFGGEQLDPGWRGHVTVNLQNVGPEAVTITLGAPLFTVAFDRLEEPASRGYSGPNQDQKTFPDDQVEHILSARTTSLAEIPVFRVQIARLTAMVEAIFDRLPDPDEGLELRVEVEQALRQSLEKPRESFLTADEMRSRLDL